MAASRPNPPAKTGKQGAAPRISSKLREAIDMMVTGAKTQKAVAEEIGMGETSLSRALARPHVRAHLEQQKQRFALEVDELKGLAQKRAILVGLELMEAPTPAPTRARMVELFTGGGRGGVNVAVQINHNQGGYEYASAGQRVVDITPAPDGASVDDEGQAPDNTED